MKQALRVAFGFLMLWAAVLHAEVRIEITQGVDSARRLGLCHSSGLGRVLHLKISVALLALTCATAVNLIR
ncbi:translocation protein TolB [Citrobacter amalonaticus]|nr:translocation protein TolB [Citrobacter amalonaticus]